MDFTELRATFDRKTITEILNVTIENANEFFKTLNKACRDKNYKNMYDSCHNIIAMGFVGNHTLFNVCKQINDTLRNKTDNVSAKDAETIEKLTKNIMVYEQDLIDQINAELNQK